MADETKAKQKRIFEIAKELNISHIEILKYLHEESIPCKTIMTAVDEETYEKILEEFAKEKSVIERIRKERARREAESKRKVVEETIKSAELERKKLEERVFKDARILIDSAQDTVLQYGNDIKSQLIREVIEVEERTDVTPGVSLEEAFQEERKGITPVEVGGISEEIRLKHKKGREKRKFRRIEISDIETRLEQKGKRKTADVKGVGRKGKREKKELKVDEKDIKESIRRTMAQIDEKTRRKKYKKQGSEKTEEVEGINRIRVSEFATVENLASLISVDPSDIIQKCVELGLFVTINQRLEMDAITVIADEFGYEVEQVEQYGEDLLKVEETEEDLKNAVPRPPVVVIMGHVDHGKTSLLDYVRETNVVAGEAGGITQHIGAYEVQLKSGKRITFLDTPGHEAFTSMRARGAQITDIVVLVVAADDGVMPQTIEAINHSKAADVPIIVAINKIDKPGVDIEKVKRDLSEHGILVEDWGGKIQSAEISAKEGTGIDHLFELIVLESELLDLKANENTLACGTVIESKVDKRHGPMATVLIQKGKLNISDIFVCGLAFGRVRAILDERGVKRQVAKPADPVQVVGFDVAPQAADVFAVVQDEREARKIASERQRIKREQLQRHVKEWTLDSISEQIADGKIKQLNVVLKGDVDGSIEAIAEALNDMGNKEVSIDIIHKAIGQINETDVLLAKASQAVIMGFNVSETPKIRDLAKQENVEIRNYNVIYELTEDAKLALEGLLAPEQVEKHLGEAEVRDIFKIPRVGCIAGCYIVDGLVNRTAKARIKRDDQILFEGFIESLRRFKDGVKEVKEGFECGVGIDGFSDFQVGDSIEFYELKSVKRTLP